MKKQTKPKTVTKKDRKPKRLTKSIWDIHLMIDNINWALDQLEKSKPKK